MVRGEKLSELAEAEITELTASGITLTPAEIVKINALGWAVESPSTRMGLARGIPISVGGAVLWPMTLCATSWVSRIGDTIHPKDMAVAIAYGMAHGRSEHGEFDVGDELAVKAAIEWGKRLTCTPEELVEAIEQVTDQDSIPDLPDLPGNGDTSLDELSMFLAASCGGTPEAWERNCSVSYALGVINRVIRQNMADGKPVAGDSRLMAERALGFEIERIRKLRESSTAE